MEILVEGLSDPAPAWVPSPREGWTRAAYRADMKSRGITEARDVMGFGIDGYLDLAQAWGLLEYRPNTRPEGMHRPAVDEIRTGQL
jgi:hypothetical protein